MKVKIIPLILLPVIFISCVYTPNADYKKMQQKTSYEKFNQINNPVVFNFDNRMEFSLYGNQDYGNTYYYGSYMIIYDWENNKVFDYVYVPGSRGCNENQRVLPCALVAGKSRFYSADISYKTLNCLENCSTEIQSMDYEDRSRFGTAYWAETTVPTEEKLLKYYSKSYDSDNYEETWGLTLFDARTEIFEDEVTFKTRHLSTKYAPVYDSFDNGSYWVTSFSENHKTYEEQFEIRKFDTKNNKLGDIYVYYNRHAGKVYDEIDGWNGYCNYTLEAVTENYLIVSRNAVNQDERVKDDRGIFLINKADKSEKFYTLSDGSDFNIQKIFYVNGLLYILAAEKTDTVTSFKFYCFNPADGKVNDCGVEFSPVYSCCYAIRGSRIYFTTYDQSASSEKIFYFDTATNALSEPQVFVLSEIAG